MGFFARFGRSGADGVRTTTRTQVRENFKIKVPKDKAVPVQHALEGWVQQKGWAAVVNAKAAGDYVELSFQHQEDLPGKPPDLATGQMTDELQKVLEGALKPPAA
ncbi:MAG: hypothetical protein ACJ76Z_10220 [Thermoleophilaceae bacterium]